MKIAIVMFLILFASTASAETLTTVMPAEDSNKVPTTVLNKTAAWAEGKKDAVILPDSVDFLADSGALAKVESPVLEAEAAPRFLYKFVPIGSGSSQGTQVHIWDTKTSSDWNFDLWGNNQIKEVTFPEHHQFAIIRYRSLASETPEALYTEYFHFDTGAAGSWAVPSNPNFVSIYNDKTHMIYALNRNNGLIYAIGQGGFAHSGVSIWDITPDGKWLINSRDSYYPQLNRQWLFNLESHQSFGPFSDYEIIGEKYFKARQVPSFVPADFGRVLYKIVNINLETGESQEDYYSLPAPPPAEEIHDGVYIFQVYTKQYFFDISRGYDQMQLLKEETLFEKIPGRTYPASVNPQSALTAIQTAVSKTGLQFEYNTRDIGWAATGLAYDNFGTAEIETQDFSQMSYFSLRLSGDVEKIKVEIQDAAGNKAFVYLDGIQSGTPQNREVFVSELQEKGIDVTKIRLLYFIVEGNNLSGHLNIETGAGTIHQPEPYVLPETQPSPFHGFPGKPSLAYVIPEGAEVKGHLGNEHDDAYLDLEYQIGTHPGAGGGLTYDNFGTPEIETQDFSQIDYLSFKLKADAFVIKFEVVDADDRKAIFFLQTSPNQVQTYRIDKSQLVDQEIDLTRIRLIYFTVIHDYQSGHIIVTYANQPKPIKQQEKISEARFWGRIKILEYVKPKPLQTEITKHIWWRRINAQMRRRS